MSYLHMFLARRLKQTVCLDLVGHVRPESPFSRSIYCILQIRRLIRGQSKSCLTVSLHRN